MHTSGPLPSWLDLLRALVRRPRPDAELAAPWVREGELAGWLSRSRWSLALIAIWRKRFAAGSPVTVWIPDYFCNSSLAPLRAAGVNLAFYPLTEKMAPDMSVCRDMQKRAVPDIFLLVHFFGQPIATGAAAEFCHRNGTWLIEDAAHVLSPTRAIGMAGDFALYSPHKHLPIPEGAVLVVRQAGPGRLGSAEIDSFGTPSGWAGQLQDLQLWMGCSTGRSRMQSGLWLARCILRKLGLRGRGESTYREQTNPAGADFPILRAPVHGGLARRLLAGLIADLGTVARYRERHQLLWDALLLSNNGARSPSVSTTDRPLHREWIPYLAGYNVDPEHAEATYRHWQWSGLPVTTWSDLPPEVRADPSQHLMASILHHSRLYLPVHQSLNALDLTRRFPRSKASLEDKACLKFTWNVANRVQWEEWLGQTGRSNVLQSWAYGLAKADTSAWRVTRAVIDRAGEPVALVQVLRRRIAGIVMVSRINRGPLYLRSTTQEEKRAVWNELGRLGRIQKGRLLSVAPEAELTGKMLLLLAAGNFKQFAPVAWESAWVDLGLDLEFLRKQLDSKWRNMLSFSERTGIMLDISGEDASFEWMLDRYRENMQLKNFQGPSIELLRKLRTHLDTRTQPIVLRALIGGEAVAGICLVPHGVAATYLIGWNGSDGRDLKANQFLLWNAIVHLKQRGFRWFDLGGIESERSPGIASFKLGLNGERYESVGEFWKW